jgi:dynein assembly factor 3, axonemal
MEIVNQIGHVQFWGMSPACNVLQHYPSAQRPVRILMSGCSDPRHILKTLCDIGQQRREYPAIEVYFHETNKELLCRCLLLLHVLHETALNFDERIELFLDLFGNAMIKYSHPHSGNGMRGTCTT